MRPPRAQLAQPSLSRSETGIRSKHREETLLSSELKSFFLSLIRVGERRFRQDAHVNELILNLADLAHHLDRLMKLFRHGVSLVDGHHHEVDVRATLSLRLHDDECATNDDYLTHHPSPPSFLDRCPFKALRRQQGAHA